MKEYRMSLAATAVLFAVSGCTQTVDAVPPAEATGDTPAQEQIEQALSANSVEAYWDLPTDWSNNVKIRMYRCGWSPAAAQNEATCQVGSDWVLVGGGAEIEGQGNPGALLTGSFPDILPWIHVWHATSKDHLYAYPHRLRAYAIGMKLGSMTRQQLFENMTQTSSPPFGDLNQAVAALPPGYILIGGGARPPSNTQRLLTASQPWFNNTWRIATKDHGVVDTTHETRAVAIGIKQCPENFGSQCLQSRYGGAGTQCSSSGYCTAVSIHPFGWPTTSIGAASTYNLDGRLLTHMAPMPPVPGTGVQTSYATSKDHGWVDTGFTYSYYVQLQKIPPLPPK